MEICEEKPNGQRNPSNLLARECLATALMQLVEKRPLSAISISELAKKAGVSRMTYYRNYASKEEIFSQYLDDIIESYRADVGRQPENSGFFSYANIVHCFEYFEKYHGFIQCLLKVDMGNILLDALTAFCLDRRPPAAEDARRRYILEAYAGSLYNTYIGWVQSGLRESAEEMAAILYSIFAHVFAI